MMNQEWNLRGIYKMDIQHKISLSDTEITSIVNFIEYYNSIQQADQDLLNNIARKLDQIVINHRENVIKAQSKRPKEEW